MEFAIVQRLAAPFPVRTAQCLLGLRCLRRGIALQMSQGVNNRFRVRRSQSTLSLKVFNHILQSRCDFAHLVRSPFSISRYLIQADPKRGYRISPKLSQIFLTRWIQILFCAAYKTGFTFTGAFVAPTSSNRVVWRHCQTRAFQADNDDG
jgi:hypothetical protein